MEIDANKSTILLMHGSGLSHIVWSLHEQFYASSGFNVLAVDLPGHGNSDGPAIKSIQEISDWIKKLMQEVNIKKITIVGHYQGSLVGIDFSSRYPELIYKLVLNIKGKLEQKGLIEYSFSHFDLETEVFFLKVKKIHFYNYKWIKKNNVNKIGLPTIMIKIIGLAY